MNPTDGLIHALALDFPVSCASDEFYFFPHCRPGPPPWKTWDRYDRDAVAEWGTRLDRAVAEADRDLRGPLADDLRIKRSMFRQAMARLRLWLCEVRAWETQPSFYLTLACVGLAGAAASKHPDALRDRAGGLADFLRQAGKNLAQPPELHRTIGLNMIPDARRYFQLLRDTAPELNAALAALDDFEARVKTIRTRPSFLLPEDTADALFRIHAGSESATREGIQAEINRERFETIREMEASAREIVPEADVGVSRSELPDAARRRLPMPAAGNLLDLDRTQAEALAVHCFDQGFLDADLATAAPVRVRAVPAFMTAVRTASSYSVFPEHPPRGGVFYVINADDPEEIKKDYQREYRMLTAHETFPGHHLLDAFRWNNPSPLRRVVERPVFYEGWACFSEVLLYHTGYFSGPGDRFLLARRRRWRAIRGMVDLGLQTGAMDLPAAAGHLMETGMDRRQALNAAGKYTLNPGYQICYTLGIRRFLALFDQSGGPDAARFVRVVLTQGQIGFRDLEMILTHHTNMGDHS